MLGLAVAICNIKLITTFNPHLFASDYISFLVPPLAFIMACHQASCREPVWRALALPRDCLQRAQAVPLLRNSPVCYTKMIDFLVKHNKIDA